MLFTDISERFLLSLELSKFLLFCAGSWKYATEGRCGLSYLELLEVVAVPRPVDLREKVLVKHLAHQLEQVNLHLVERLVLEQAV